MLYPYIRFYSSTTTVLPSHVQLVHACLLQYKGIRLYSHVTVRHKIEENRNLTEIDRSTRTGLERGAHYSPITFSTSPPDGIQLLRLHDPLYVRKPMLLNSSMLGLETCVETRSA